MGAIRVIVSVLAALAVSACTTPYQSSGLTGGFTEKELEPGVWRVAFGGNGFTTAETVQTYWLYRSAQLAQEKGFDGFEILSNLQLVRAEPPIQIAAGAPIFIPIYTGDGGPKPTIEGDIQLLKAPIQPRPPKVFIAGDLKAALDPYVNGKKCDTGNICAHVHRYLQPDPAMAGSPDPAQTRPGSANPAERVAADFSPVAEFHCPGIGTDIKTSAHSEFKFASANGLRCGYTDESGQARERYALFTDGYGRLARKEMDGLWPLKVGNSVSFDLSDANAVQPGDRFVSPNLHESFAVTRQQRVSVPAGTFDTFVIEWRERGISNSNKSAAMITMWYAPQVGYVVKSTVRIEDADPRNPYATSVYEGMRFEATEIAMPNGEPLPVATGAPAATPVAAPPASASSADRLKALNDMRDQKLITPEEYDARRKAILDGL